MMRFFTPTEPFTHHAKFWGIPCYYKGDGPDGCMIGGTNVIYDWMVLHIVPHCFGVVETIRSFMDPMYETQGWPILVGGKIHEPKAAQ